MLRRRKVARGLPRASRDTTRPGISRLGLVLASVALATVGVAQSTSGSGVTATSATTVAADSFTRSITAGWGDAEVGGAYALRGPPTAFNVDGSSGTLTFGQSGSTREVSLGGVMVRDVDLSFRFATSRLAIGGASVVWAVARGVATNSAYRLNVRAAADGSLGLGATALDSGQARTIGSAVRLLDVPHADGESVRFRGEVQGVDPTTIRMRAWADGSPEPSDWAYVVKDRTQRLQRAGLVGLGGTFEDGPVSGAATARFDDLRAINLSAAKSALTGAGDIASCTGLGDEATADLLDGIPGTVFAAGDEAYESGTAAEFTDCYDPSWGRHRERTLPAAGNHEYQTPGATGYFSYFGASAGPSDRGYYAADVGSWRIYVLNSMCGEVGGCGYGSQQEQWLRADLAAQPRLCVAAIWHHPRFSSSGSNPELQPLWQDLYDFGAEIVISGHAHNYERFAPQTADGDLDVTRGIRQFVVGTGGRSHSPFVTQLANSEARNDSTYGVLRLKLGAKGYSWRFIPVTGRTFTDAGTGSCH